MKITTTINEINTAAKVITKKNGREKKIEDYSKLLIAILKFVKFFTNAEADKRIDEIIALLNEV